MSFFLAQAFGRFPLYVPSTMSWVYAKRSGNLFIRTYLLHARASSLRMKECPGALAAKMLLMKSVHQVLSGFWIQRPFLLLGEMDNKEVPCKLKAVKYQWYCGPFWNGDS